MIKPKTTFFCQHCGSQYAQWLGQCKSCHEWNSIVEEVVQKPTKKNWSEAQPTRTIKALKIDEIEADTENRIITSDKEFNNVLGGGIVNGSVVLLGGEPGIGKSTLLLQIALSLPYKSLYISGEESLSQLKMRANRLQEKASKCYIFTDVQTQKIFKTIEEVQPKLVIVDSIQTLYTSNIESSPGAISQIKETASEFIQFAKETSTPVLLIGHITKEGAIAGPKILEHMVDVVLQFEGERNHSFRILRGTKNRFGSTSELGIYEMNYKGLNEVTNPSEILISQKDDKLSGTAIAATLEGSRPLLIEVQSLVSSAVYGTPQRTTTGFDLKRLHMLLAVLEKRAGFKLSKKDVFLNIAGGIRVDDPAIDLSVIVAILSSNTNIPMNQDCCFAAEVGLAGEIRAVNRIEQRISEAEKLGYKEIVISKFNKIRIKNSQIKITELGKVETLFEKFFLSKIQ